MSRPTYMTIDLDALKHNLARVRTYAPAQSVIAMVKANAYGHGVERVALALANGADAFGVASLDEGLRLREAGIKQPIVLMEGLFYADELQEAAHQQFTLVIHHLPHIEMLEKASHISQPFSIWLKINTGMHRLGIPIDHLSAYYQRLLNLPIVNKPIGLMTHFAEADVLNSTATMSQYELFEKTIAGLSGPRSLANSAAILAHPHTHGNWVRPGLILYGASPFTHQTGSDHQLKPVMTLRSQLIAITEVKKGNKVGYGGTWTAEEDTRFGVVAIGYGDGYPQFAQPGTPILVNGIECPLIGRVSMDMLTVDLKSVPEAVIGDPVILWGAGLPVERVAQFSRTSAWEILTRMTPRPKLDIKGQV
jgi:alanine racemase